MTANSSHDSKARGNQPCRHAGTYNVSLAPQRVCQDDMKANKCWEDARKSYRVPVDAASVYRRIVDTPSERWGYATQNTTLADHNWESPRECCEPLFPCWGGGGGISDGGRIDLTSLSIFFFSWNYYNLIIELCAHLFMCLFNWFISCVILFLYLLIIYFEILLIEIRKPSYLILFP